MSDFGDFEEVKDERKAPQPEVVEQPIARVRNPRQGQVLGVVVQRLGGNRMSIRGTDNKVRNCRVPGRFRRRFWLRPGDAVIIEPWPDDDDKGDIVYQYRKGEMYQLRKKGLLKGITNTF